MLQGTLPTTQTTFNNSTIPDVDDNDEEEEEEKCADIADEIDEFFMDNGKIHKDDISNDDIHFVERTEESKPTLKSCRSWVLRSGTNVGQNMLLRFPRLKNV